MTKVSDILAFVQTLAPQHYACDWDNNGLLVGCAETEVTKVLIALDPFMDAAQEAADWGAQVLLTHHPLIFSPLKSVTNQTAVGRTVQLLLANGISAINAHTSLDIAPGGVNDCLAAKLGLRNITAVGEDCLMRFGTVDAQPLEAFLEAVKSKLNSPVLRYVQGCPVCRNVVVGGGSCAGEMQDAIAAGCDTFVTADCKYNHFWDAKDAGINLIDAGHFYTENPVCFYLKDRLSAQFPNIEVKISEKHTDCMKFFG